MSYFYNFGGLKVCSSFTLKGIQPFDGETTEALCDVRFLIDNSTQSEESTLVFQWPSGRYGMSLWSCGQNWLVKTARNGSYLISDSGYTISCFPDSRYPSDDMGEFIVRRLMPRLAILHGGIALHVASLSDGKNGYLLMGPSGAGKSTLTANLHHKLGWDILSDDISILHHGDPPTVSPSTVGVCLHEDSLSSLGSFASDVKKLSAYENKFWVGFGKNKNLTPKPIKNFILLTATSDTHTPPGRALIERISTKKAFQHIWQQLVRFNPTNMVMETYLFKSIGSFVNASALYNLTYPKEYNEIECAIEKINRLSFETPEIFQ